MTESNYCCLCASDEGIFLDIFKATHRQLGNRSLLKELETCLSVKVDREESLSSKICHKCAIELGECHQFVENYNHKASKAAATKVKKTAANKSCCLCFTGVKKKYLFQLAEDFQSKIDPIQKIYECFHKSITREESEGLLICLFCRYNLDILYDLKKLAREVTSKLEKITECKAVIASLPKTETFVVSRKTTIHSAAKLHYTSGSDSEYNNMAPKQLRSKRLKNFKHPQQLKFRTCGQCETSIQDGIDMYRLHRTGLTVCKACWITMDPISTTTGNKRKPNTQTESKNTRLCAVFVKDVLSSASSKDNGSCNVEKDEKGDEIYVVSDNSDIHIPHTKATRKTRQKRGVDDDKSELEPIPASWSRTKRSVKQLEADSDSRPNKRLKSVQNAIVTIPLEKEKLRRSTRLQSSDSEGVSPPDNWNDVSEAKKVEIEEKSNNLHNQSKSGKIKSYGNSTKLKTNDAGSRGGDLPPEVDTEAGKELRKVRNKVPLISVSALPTIPKTRNLPIRSKQSSASLGLKQDLKIIEKSESNDESIANQRLPLKVKTTPKRSKKLMMVSFPFKFKDPYVCKVCKTEYKNKVIGMKHELTHFKQVQIKVEKLNVDNNFQTFNENSEMNKITQETSDVSCSLEPPQVIEKLLDPEVPTSAGHVEQVNESEPDTTNREIVCRDSPAELLLEDNKSVELESPKETDSVNTSNRPPSEESTSVVDNSLNVPDVIAQDSDLVDDNVSENIQTPETKVDEIHPEPNLLTESNHDDDNDATEEISNEKLDKSLPEEVPKELEQTITNTEETNVVEHTNDEDVIATTAPSNKSSEVVEKVSDSGKDEESDMHSLTVDTDNLLEDFNKHTDKLEDETKNKTDVLALSDTNHVDEELTETKESKKITDDNLDAVVTTKVDIVDTDPGARDESINPSLEDNKHSMTENIPEDVISESRQDIKQPDNGTNNNALSTVTEILQEVIDLATAEVQKRSEKDVISEPETLESISKEIEKSTDEISTRILVEAQEKLVSE